MNRTLTNVLFGGIGTTVQSDFKIEGTITKTTVDETVEALNNADNVILVRDSADFLFCGTDIAGRLLDTEWLWRRLSMRSRRL